ncbi:LysR family transcriptional regulator [Kiloniella sp.]|uniref:LysR family transcriptional regulator n=1 Tax=Kiloniella sp. TaxID=1938587 RepID=UPI003B0168FD
MINWDDIKYFLEVARSGNITAAAKKLGVNHSTVSRRIQALEEQNGVRLFERIPTGYEMTEAASNIYEYALEIEARNHDIARGLVGQDSRLQGDINVTMPHDLLDYCLMEEVKRFKVQHPLIRLNLVVAKGVKNLAAREADVAIRLTPNPPDYLIGKEITKIQHGIYANKHLEINSHTPVIVWCDETNPPSWVQEQFPNAEIALRVDDLYSMYAAVKAGIGVAKMPCYVPDTIADDEVRRVAIDIPPSSWGIWILSHIDLRHTARVRECRLFLGQCLEVRKALFEGRDSAYK